mmetsp:Transcript_59504/g.87223  ORF Transcript_59504/g.87223 Transcript_59504/m.87223 type:complete len:129 (-) Transcript_59504:491-877(-)
MPCSHATSISMMSTCEKPANKSSINFEYFRSKQTLLITHTTGPDPVINILATLRIGYTLKSDAIRVCVHDTDAQTPALTLHLKHTRHTDHDITSTGNDIDPVPVLERAGATVPLIRKQSAVDKETKYH